jgi:hypothetical protein
MTSLRYDSYLEDLRVFGKGDPVDPINSQKIIPYSPKGKGGLGGKRDFGKFSPQLLDFYRSEGLLTLEGKPRLACARSYFLDQRNIDLEGLVEYFLTWMDYNEYLVLQKQSFDGKEFEKDTIAVKCSKRGNDVYKSRVKKRFSFMSTLENKILFDWKNKTKKTHKVNCVFVTLTFNPALCSINEAWEVRVGREYNTWVTNLRNKFGRVEAIRTFEGYANGYPHIHVVLLFGDKEFTTFKDGNDKWRIEEKEVFELSWKSFVDVQAMRDLRGGLFYLSKHILKAQVVQGDPTKEEDLWKYYLTLALNWVFKKRSFALSKGFLDLMYYMHNSNSSRVVQMTLEGDPVVVTFVWVCLGVFSAESLGIDNNSWSVELDNKTLSRIV